MIFAIVETPLYTMAKIAFKLVGFKENKNIVHFKNTSLERFLLQCKHCYGNLNRIKSIFYSKIILLDCLLEVKFSLF
jgi:hypothetical protein